MKQVTREQAIQIACERFNLRPNDKERKYHRFRHPETLADFIEHNWSKIDFTQPNKKGTHENYIDGTSLILNMRELFCYAYNLIPNE